MVDKEGVRLTFPFSPYPSQIEYMETLIKALNQRCNAFLESPTGTGKTLSLLLPAIAYQAHYVEFCNMLTKLSNSFNSKESPTSRSSSDYNSLTNQIFTARGRAHDLFQWAERTLDLKGTILFSNQTKQISIRNTGLKDIMQHPPRIIYTSRTHAQLEQAMVQLTKYGRALYETFGVDLLLGWPPATLGSRRVFCINERAKNYANAAQITMDMACKKVCDDRQCIYYFSEENKTEIAQQYNEHYHTCREKSTTDIEDFLGYCRKKSTCPYYLGRALVEHSGLITTPYNYIFSSKIRTTELTSMLTNSIILVDEGHNLSQACCDMFSAQIDFSSLLAAVSELQYLQDVVRKQRLSPGEKSARIELESNNFQGHNSGRNTGPTTTYNGLLEPKKKHVQKVNALLYQQSDMLPSEADINTAYNIIQSVVTYFMHRNPNSKEEIPTMIPAQELARHIYNSLLFSTFDASIKNSKGSTGLKSKSATDKETSDFYLSKVALNSLSNYQQKQREFSLLLDTLAIFLQSNSQLAPKYTDKPIHLPAAKDFVLAISDVIAYSEMGTEFYLVISAQNNNDPEKKISSTGLARDMNQALNNYIIRHSDPSKTKNSVGRSLQLHLICMAAEPILKSILLKESVRSLILTSGTLTPFAALQAELGIPVKYTLSCPHIVPSFNYLARIIRSVNKTSLLGTYKSREDHIYQRALGYALHACTYAVAGGTLVFFASYKFMDQIMTAWKKDGLQAKLRQGAYDDSRDLFVETTDQKECDSIVQHYKSSCDAGKSPILFVVCHGKLAEGIDFTDHYCRCAVVVSLPYPNLTDPLLKLKMNWLDKNSALKGSDWYSAQAYRSINQALGRVLRHKDDYGCMFLLDQRYSAAESRSQLSGWLAPYFSSIDLQGIDVHKEEMLSDIHALYSKFNQVFGIKRGMAVRTSIAKNNLTAINFKDGNEMAFLMDHFTTTCHQPTYHTEPPANEVLPNNTGAQQLLVQLKERLSADKYKRLKTLLYNTQHISKDNERKIRNICSDLAILLSSRALSAEVRTLLKLLPSYIAVELENQISFLRGRQ